MFGLSLTELFVIGAIVWLLWRFSQQHQVRQRSEAMPKPSASGRDPWDTLGLSRSATAQDIREAYQRLVRQYHPDRVADMGPEIREVAERKTKEINAAYAELKRG